jgi:hypothetical protein
MPTFASGAEEIEKHDWDITPQMTNSERKKKSISSYYLPAWYEKIKDWTCKTFFYSLEELPEKLPFDKCMVRWENKSPKTSPDWGPVSTREQALNLFKTSLRCQDPDKKGQIYCVREWIPGITAEYRCFYNQRLRAVSAQNESEPPHQEILDYLRQFIPYIPYYRCVFDIAKTPDGYLVIEFNSWETNAGAHYFNWTDDTEIFYEGDDTPNQVIFKWGEHSKTIEFHQPKSQICKEMTLQGTLINDSDWANMKIMIPVVPSSWLVTDKYIYVANDIWLGMFTHEMKRVYIIRGVFRFCNLQLCTDGSIYADGSGYKEASYYHSNLTEKKTKSHLAKLHIDVPAYPQFSYKYGMVCQLKTGKMVFVRWLQDGSFMIEKDLTTN